MARLKLPTTDPIAHLDGWSLHVTHETSTEEWINLKLIVRPRPKKRWGREAFRLGWNGYRFANDRELRTLVEQEPTRYAALCKFLSGVSTYDLLSQRKTAA